MAGPRETVTKAIAKKDAGVYFCISDLTASHREAAVPLVDGLLLRGRRSERSQKNQRHRQVPINPGQCGQHVTDGETQWFPWSAFKLYRLVLMVTSCETGNECELRSTISQRLMCHCHRQQKNSRSSIKRIIYYHYYDYCNFPLFFNRATFLELLQVQPGIIIT